MNINSTAMLLLSLCLLQACSTSSNDSAIEPEVRLDQIPQALIGFWERPGYGEIYELSTERSRIYAINSANCVFQDDVLGFPNTDKFDLGLIAVETVDDRYSKITPPGALFPYMLKPLAALPTACTDPINDSTQAQFDQLWNDFNDYYAFFEKRNVNWAAQYATVSPLVGSTEPGSDEFFNVLVELLRPIDDGHVFVIDFDNNNGFSPSIDRGIFGELQTGFEAQSEFTDFDEYETNRLTQLQRNVFAKLDTDSLTDAGQLSWATINSGSLGYLYINGMAGYSQSEDATCKLEQQAAGEVIDTAMLALQNTQALIIDIRLNGGGCDSVGFEIASRFNDTEQIALSKTANNRGSSTPKVEATLEASLNPYLAPVVLLAGRDTGSAAEIFAIIMRQLPAVTQMGQPTAGALSDVLVKQLPNNWYYGLSNERYLDAEGVAFEAVGVPPDVLAPSPTIDDIIAGRDPGLDAAISTLLP